MWRFCWAMIYVEYTLPIAPYLRHLIVDLGRDMSLTVLLHLISFVDVSDRFRLEDIMVVIQSTCLFV